MKVVNIKGGLGNQMFQYAFGQVLGPDTLYDNAFYSKKVKEGEMQRFYELIKWNITPALASAADIRKAAHQWYLESKCPKCIRRLIRAIKPKRFDGIRKEKIRNVYDETLLSGEGYFDGYFQCAQYYDSIRPKLLKDFTPAVPVDTKNQDMIKLIESVNSVSLHVRRTDYVKLASVYGACDLEYYAKAVDYIAAHVKNPHFFLFSDDIEWVRKNLKLPGKSTVVDLNSGSDSFLDIWLMKHCKHNIIANSSFSWWGAWLNENPDKIVIAPEHWMLDDRPCEIVPEDWVRISSDVKK